LPIKAAASGASLGCRAQFADIWGGSPPALFPPPPQDVSPPLSTVRLAQQKSLLPARRGSSADSQASIESSIDGEDSKINISDILDFLDRHGLYIAPLDRQENVFLHHFTSCLRKPAGRADAAGSQRCSFEYSAPCRHVVTHLLSGLELHSGVRYNSSLMATQQTVWEKSNSIDTYAALDDHTLDHYLVLHRRAMVAAAKKVYRGTALTKEGDVAITILPPLLAEVCRRSWDRLVIAVTFNIATVNDAQPPLVRLPPGMHYPEGADNSTLRRVLGHLRAMHSRGIQMSAGFRQHVQTAPCPSDSESDCEVLYDAPSSAGSDSDMSYDVSPQQPRVLPGRQRRRPRAAYAGADEDQEGKPTPMTPQ
jgi:hypothetical protein